MHHHRAAAWTLPEVLRQPVDFGRLALMGTGRGTEAYLCVCVCVCVIMY